MSNAAEEIQLSLAVVTDPAVDLTEATVAFYRFRKLLEEAGPQAARPTLPGSYSGEEPRWLFGYCDVQPQEVVEDEPTIEEWIDTFPPSDACAVPAQPRSPHAPDFWALAKDRRIGFGKHGPKSGEAKTVYWVYENDPGWLEWAYGNVDRLDPQMKAIIQNICNL